MEVIEFVFLTKDPNLKKKTFFRRKEAGHGIRAGGRRAGLVIFLDKLT